MGAVLVEENYKLRVRQYRLCDLSKYMSVYHTVELTREEAIKRLMEVWKMPQTMSNHELEQALFNAIGREGLPNSTLENFIVK